MRHVGHRPASFFRLCRCVFPTCARIWIGSDQFLDSLHPVTEAFTHHRIGSFDPNGIPNPVVCISQDNGCLLWLSTQDGLYSFNPTTGSIAHFIHDPSDPSSLSSNDIKSAGEDKQGKLWVVSSEGLDLLDRSTRKVTHHIALNIPARESSFYEDRLGPFWIIFASGEGLMVLDRKTNTLTRYSLYDEKSAQAIEYGVYAMLEDQD